jgi:16S rRNA (guanine966-N2)-methyltransferase
MTSYSGRIRIIGGRWRSRIITFPAHADLRPTPDRVRETLFNWLGQDLTGLNCLDLFAGSGALGFEAASRGAANVVMIESGNSVHQALSENKTKLKADSIELIRMDASVFLVTDTRKFDIVFLDPPYRMDILPKILTMLPPLLAADAQVYLETEYSCDLEENLQHWHIRRKGKAGKVNYYLLEMNRDLNSHG